MWLLVLLCAFAIAHGDNLIYNGDFELPSPEKPPPGWTMWGARKYKLPANYTRDTANPHEGEACFRIHHPAAAAAIVLSHPDPDGKPLFFLFSPFIGTIKADTQS
jgi:hypothetical protein